MCNIAPYQQQCTYETFNCMMCESEKLKYAAADLIRQLPIFKNFVEEYTCKSFIPNEISKLEEKAEEKTVKIVIDIDKDSCKNCPCLSRAETDKKSTVYLCMAFKKVLTFEKKFFDETIISFIRCDECIAAEIEDCEAADDKSE